MDRRKVASIVFSDKKALNLLNGIIHPYVRRIIRADSQTAYAGASNRRIGLDVPLLLEAGYD